MVTRATSAVQTCKAPARAAPPELDADGQALPQAPCGAPSERQCERCSRAVCLRRWTRSESWCCVCDRLFQRQLGELATPLISEGSLRFRRALGLSLFGAVLLLSISLRDLLPDDLPPLIMGVPLAIGTWYLHDVRHELRRRGHVRERRRRFLASDEGRAPPGI